MSGVSVRPATLADAAAITAVHCSHVQTWRRGGKGDPATYQELPLYDRWLHGGPWMSVETCAVHLNRWLRSGHPVLVAELEGRVVGEAEFVLNGEPPPYGPSLHLSLLFVHANHAGRGVGRALVQAGEEIARERGCVALTVQPERTAEPFYRRVGFEPWLWLREWQAPAIEGEIPLRLEPASCTPYPAQAGVVLRAGRYQCGRQAWDDLPFHLALPEHQGLPWGRWRTRLPGGGTAWLGLRAQPLEPSQADGFIWTPPETDLGALVRTLQYLAAGLEFAYVDLLLEEPEGRDLASEQGFEPQSDVTLWRKTVGTGSAE